MIKRKIIFHAGPTNSGKTHSAIERFRAADTGVYCGPLRLLATEVFRRTNDAVSKVKKFYMSLCNIMDAGSWVIKIFLQLAVAESESATAI